MRTLTAAVAFIATVSSAHAECWTPMGRGNHFNTDPLSQVSIENDRISVLNAVYCDVSGDEQHGATRVYYAFCSDEGAEEDASEFAMTVKVTPEGYGYAHLQFDDEPPALWRRCVAS